MAKKVSKEGNARKTSEEKKLANLKKGNPEHEFTSDNQPTPEAKSAGKRRKRELKELAEALITGEGLQKAKKIAASVGVDLSNEEFTLEVIMTLRQVEKALAKGDTPAYNAAMDRLRGKAKQITENTHEFKGEAVESFLDQFRDVE